MFAKLDYLVISCKSKAKNLVSKVREEQAGGAELIAWI